MASTAPTTHRFVGALFDFDGTIIDSTEAIVENWQRIASEIGVDYQKILETSHGRRSIDVFKELDPSKANWEYITAMERQIPLFCKTPAVEIPGARALLESLDRLQAPYAIVTSGTRGLLEGWLNVLQLPRPRDTTVAEDVKLGKPDPEGYSKARDRLLCAVSEGSCKDVLVLEDAPAGVKAGKAAGCHVLAVTTTHTVQELRDAGADWIVPDHRSVEVSRGGDDGGFVFTFRDLA